MKTLYTVYTVGCKSSTNDTVIKVARSDARPACKVIHMFRRIRRRESINEITHRHSRQDKCRSRAQDYSTQSKFRHSRSRI